MNHINLNPRRDDEARQNGAAFVGRPITAQSDSAESDSGEKPVQLYSLGLKFGSRAAQHRFLQCRWGLRKNSRWLRTGRTGVGPGRTRRERL